MLRPSDKGRSLETGVTQTQETSGEKADTYTQDRFNARFSVRFTEMSLASLGGNEILP